MQMPRYRKGHARNRQRFQRKFLQQQSTKLDICQRKSPENVGIRQDIAVVYKGGQLCVLELKQTTSGSWSFTVIMA
eukprot:scaffold131058_cov18-Tisochrysis_lutea.AAC.2